ncbi:MAG: hypothetical protein M3430_20910 [Acidobacteriota bacterium]|nr:hypothetical protein [Acidobacteriota bacterium]
MGSAVLAKVATEWEHDGSSRNHRPKRTDVTNDAGQITSATYDLYGSYNNLRVMRERGFGGEELRRTEIEYETGAAWVSNRLLHLPTSVKIFGAGQSSPTSRVEYAYDTAGTNLVSRSDLIMFDAIYNPIYGVTSTDYRGNVRTVTRYADAAAGTGAEVDTFTYDIAGNLVTETADCCRQRSYTYTKAFEYAYATEVARGDAGQLRATVNYDFNTGLIRSVADENNQTTTNHFYQTSLRFYRTERPDGGYVYNQYFDQLYPNPDPEHTMTGMQTTTLMSSGGSVIDGWEEFDGRGATSRSWGTWTPDGYPDVDTEYDVMGRLWRQSNPYYNNSPHPFSTAGPWTTYGYDGLGRVRFVTLADGNVVEAQYAGRDTTVIDPAGKSRRSRVDGLGRLERLDEPDASGNLGAADAPAQPTSYMYNAIDNLVRVTQGGQQRFFKYDSLGRMTHERQVEMDAPHTQADPLTLNTHWSRRMVYNTHDLVTDAYDARGVHTHFEYDGLNRVRDITYSDATPQATYTYDEARSGYFNRGRLTTATTASTADAPQTSQAYDYDLMESRQPPADDRRDGLYDGLRL